MEHEVLKDADSVCEGCLLYGNTNHQSYFCEKHRCIMTGLKCTLYKTRKVWRKAYDEMRGPGQNATEEESERSRKVLFAQKNPIKGKLLRPKKHPKQIKAPGYTKLGDHIGKALKVIGITDERVTQWLGRPCRCPERRERLNQLGAWAHRVLSGHTEKADEYLEEIINNGDP